MTTPRKLPASIVGVDNLHLEHLGAHRTAFPAPTPAYCGRILLLGEDNPQSSDPRHALFPHPRGCAGNRLQRDIFGIDRATYLAMWRTNLCNPRWSLPAARKRAAEILLDDEVPWRVVVLLGAKVADVVRGVVELFPADVELSLFNAGEFAGRTLVCLPHPSGRNRAWNDPRAAGAARRIMHDVAPEISWGSEVPW